MGTPLIGISTNYETVSSGKFLGTERIYLNRAYVDAVQCAGGIPLLLPPVEGREELERYVDICDGFILSGGGDVNPLLFGCDPHPALEAVHTSLDRSQWLLTELILETDKPLLAICRGEQLLNVVLGGTLYQDMSEYPGAVLQHSQTSAPGDRIHRITFEPDSIPGKLFGAGIAVNSLHHQCVKSPGKGLRIVARSADGVIEAVQSENKSFVLGVQWHPELLPEGADNMLPLWDAFIAASSSR